MEAAASSSTAPATRSWSSLPADILELILKRLPWSTHPRFAAACTHWRSVVSPFYPAWLTPLLFNAVDVGSTNVRYYSPYFHKNFEIANTLQTPNARICCSSGHRLTLCQRAGLEIIVVDVNLATDVIYDLLPLACDMSDFVVYDGSKRMFGIDAFGALHVARAIQCEDGDGWYGWKSSEYRHDGPKLPAAPMTNPVLHRGLLYLLGVDGRLAVHDDRRHEEGFRILDKPKGFGFEHDDCYLFDSDEGELMAVLFGCRGTWVRMVRLDEREMKWVKVESLKDRALFTGTLTTTMVKTDVKCMQNKIFMPRLYDWPQTVLVNLVNLEGELAFVPKSSMVAENGGADGTKIWACEFGHEKPKEFWETIKVDYSIWVDLKN
ncbi:hypothetical protein ACP70R_006772 [Stipagrostis hirtigluma subsp. patula]